MSYSSYGNDRLINRFLLDSPQLFPCWTNTQHSLMFAASFISHVSVDRSLSRSSVRVCALLTLHVDGDLLS